MRNAALIALLPIALPGEAQVPNGAQTAPVAVTTPGGSEASVTSFKVK